MATFTDVVTAQQFVGPLVGAVTGNVAGNVSGLSGGIQGQSQILSGDGAITNLFGCVVITKALAAALTIAPPTAGTDDFKILMITSITAFAHVITQGTVGFNGKGASGTATWTAAKGNSLTLMAYQGNWYVVAANGVAIA